MLEFHKLVRSRKGNECQDWKSERNWVLKSHSAPQKRGRCQSSNGGSPVSRFRENGYFLLLSCSLYEIDFQHYLRLFRPLRPLWKKICNVYIPCIGLLYINLSYLLYLLRKLFENHQFFWFTCYNFKNERLFYLNFYQTIWTKIKHITVLLYWKICQIFRYKSKQKELSENY